MECPVCKYTLPGGSVPGECFNCGYRPERDQPTPINSDGDLRNMVDPGSGQDMGGNPLQEGILGDYQNRGVRDQSFASVKIAHRFQVGFDNPLSLLHGGNTSILNFLNSSVNGVLPDTREKDIEITMWGLGHPRSPDQPMPDPVTVDTPDPAYEPAIRAVIEHGRTVRGPKNIMHADPAARDALLNLFRAIQAGEVAPPAGKEQIIMNMQLPSDQAPAPVPQQPAQPVAPQALASVDGDDWFWRAQEIDMPYWHREAFLPALAGVAARVLGPRLAPLLGRSVAAGGMKLPNGLAGKGLQALGVHGLISGLMGGGQQQQQPMQPPQQLRGIDQLASVEGAFDHPSTIDSIGEGVGPEDVDQHEFDDGGNTENFYDPSLPEGGTDSYPVSDVSDEDAAAIEQDPVWHQLADAWDDILRYHESDESGLENPKIRALWEMFKDHAPVHARTATPLAPGTPGASVPPNNPVRPPQPIPGAGLQGEVPNQGRCPTCGGVLTAQGTCPQCGATAMPSTTPAGPAGIGQMGQTGPVHARVAINDHQGPRNNEQFAAVADLLTEEGRQDEIPAMLREPWNYADELSRVQQKSNKPPIDETAGEPQPAQEEAPPGATMPMPGMSAPGGPPPGSPMMAGARISAALQHVGADSIAPRCPKCDSATTGLLNEQGDCHCHRCGNQWTLDGAKEKISAAKTATPRLDAPEHDDLHFDPDNPVSLDAADQDRPDLEEHDTTRTWSTTDGEPLEVGQTYEMHSAEYSIPDIVRIDSIKPDSLDVSIVGEYSARGDDSAEHSRRYEIPKQEADIQRLEFHPTEFTEGEESPAEQQAIDPQTAPGEVSDLSGVRSSVLSDTDVERIASVVAQKLSTLPEMRQQGPLGVPVERQYDSSDDYWKQPKDRAWHKNIDQERTEVPTEKTEWIPGDWGRGLVDMEGNVVTWPEEQGTHEEYITRNQVKPRSLFTISPTGDIQPYSFEGTVDMSPEELELITLANPTLKAPAETGEVDTGDFQFAHMASTPDAPEDFENPEADWLYEGDGLEIPEGTPASRTAGAKMSPMEQRAFIDEDGEARNSDRLDLEGTHYEARWDAKARPDRVPDDHILLGL